LKIVKLKPYNKVKSDANYPKKFHVNALRNKKNALLNSQNELEAQRLGSVDAQLASLLTDLLQVKEENADLVLRRRHADTEKAGGGPARVGGREV
jgi:hypothetical protein